MPSSGVITSLTIAGRRVCPHRNTTVRSDTLKVSSTERDVVSLPRQEDAGHGMPGHLYHARSGSNSG